MENSIGLKIVQVAKTQIGVKEDPPNSNETIFGKWFGMQHQPWCAIFVSWVYATAGKPITWGGYRNGYAGCQTAYAYFKKNNLLVTDPMPGDIVLFDWNGDKRYDHTGIFVEWVSKNTFKSIEGNTSLTNDSNGGQVMERVRNKSVAIFARLK
jgi:hypothetical protein